MELEKTGFELQQNRRRLEYFSTRDSERLIVFVMSTEPFITITVFLYNRLQPRRIHKGRLLLQ